jgi:hypothetical protein
MRLNFINNLQRYVDNSADMGFYTDPATDPYNYDWESEGDYTNYELPDYNSPSLTVGSGTTTPLTQKSAVEPSTSPWLGSIHQLVQDASTLLLATKGVPQTQQPVAVTTGMGSTGIYSSLASSQWTQTAAAKAAADAAAKKKNTTTFVIIGIVFLVVIVAVILLTRKAK